jgi:hypothetical protein
MTLHPIPLNFLKYEENLVFFFISVQQSASKKGIFTLLQYAVWTVYCLNREKFATGAKDDALFF